MFKTHVKNSDSVKAAIFINHQELHIVEDAIIAFKSLIIIANGWEHVSDDGIIDTFFAILHS